MKYTKTEKEIFENPDEWVHLRELARRTHQSVSTVSLEIKNMGFMQEQQNGTMKTFKPKDSFEYLWRKKIFNMYRLYESGLIAYLKKKVSPRTIVLFGSYSRGEDALDSDIDIALLGSSSENLSLSRFEKRLRRSISVHRFTKDDVSKEFYANIINGVKLEGVLRP